MTLPLAPLGARLSRARSPATNSEPFRITQVPAAQIDGVRFGVRPSSAMTLSAPLTSWAMTAQQGAGIHERA